VEWTGWIEVIELICGDYVLASTAEY
jgi:hypothetical protein